MEQSQEQGFNLEQMEATHEMLIGFRKAIRESSFRGADMFHVAQGMKFLDGMVAQSAAQLQYAKDQIHKAKKNPVTVLSDKPEISVA